MPGPITPDEVHETKKSYIPEFVFEAFNELILTHYNGRCSTVKVKDAIRNILLRMEGIPQRSVAMIYTAKWLDVEDIYRKAGWDVKYEQPENDESYDEYFRFTRKRNLDRD